MKYIIEQPCKSIRDCRDVRASASVPMLLDETMVDIQAILHAYHEGAIDMVKLKISRLGGLTRTRQVDLFSTSLELLCFLLRLLMLNTSESRLSVFTILERLDVHRYAVTRCSSICSYYQVIAVSAVVTPLQLSSFPQ